VEGGGGRWRKVEEGGGRWRKVEEGGEKCEYIRLSSSDRCPSSSLYLHQVIQHVGHVFVFLRQVHHLRFQVHHTLLLVLLVLLVLQDLEINQIEKRLVVIILEIVLTHKIKI
jgi:hypothetical protein